jgi:multidrug efflux pump subunit AcrB
MSIDQFSGLCIMVAMAVFVLTVAAIYVIPVAFAQNTDGNKTGGNMTGQPGMSQEEIEALCSLSPACIT